jgi:hypothetical protein
MKEFVLIPYSGGEIIIKTSLFLKSSDRLSSFQCYEKLNRHSYEKNSFVRQSNVMSSASNLRRRRFSGRPSSSNESPRVSSPIHKKETRSESAGTFASFSGIVKALTEWIEKLLQKLREPPNGPGSTFSRGLLIFSFLLFVLSTLRVFYLVVPWCKIPGLASLSVCQDSSYTLVPYVDTDGRVFNIPRTQYITVKELTAPLSHLEDFGALHGLNFISWSYDEIQAQVDSIISGIPANSSLLKPLEGHVTSLKEQVNTLVTKSHTYKDTAVQALSTFKKLTHGLAKSLRREKPFSVGRFFGFPADVPVQTVTTLWLVFYIAIQKEIGVVRSTIHEYQADMIDLKLETLATKEALAQNYEEAAALEGFESTWKDTFNMYIANTVMDRIIELDTKGDNVTREAEIMLADASWKLNNVIDRLVRSMDRDAKPENVVVASGLARGWSVNEQLSILHWRTRTIHKMFFTLTRQQHHLWSRFRGLFEKE